ncbi:regulatory protein GemA [Sphingomonas naphthae]|uniref:Regulatory protein GemA n=1 Tax=Sphingomonas naphthae TaxID=1813468 RepID=A0ABY7TFR8_9SPHN|nr:regulatory protein GemA [Sphingomonas naphthae]WCT72076.1 regulatory protein GemA [Sphingomonas naphthae]
MSAAVSRPAQFAANPRRRALIAKVHVAKKELGLTDDDYMAVLMDVAGVSSAADCSDGQLVDVVERFKSRGFTAKAAASAPRPQRGGRPAADHKVAGKARAMWISLHQLGAVRNPSEQALEAFACRQLGCERMQWADQRLGYRLIEALKAMAEREGWSQELSAVAPDRAVRTLRLRLVAAILAKLKSAKIAPRDWSVEQAAWSLLGMRFDTGHIFASDGDLGVLAAGLGEKLRAARGV